MSEVKSTTIVPIAFYCFLLGAYFLYLTINVILSSDLLSGGDTVGWLSASACLILGGGLIALGMGILNVSKLCWKILFFLLAICISSMASLLFAFLIFLMIDVKFLEPYFHMIQTTSITWFSCLGIFLSGIIVLFYLSHEDVLSTFGDMGPLISPF